MRVGTYSSQPGGPKGLADIFIHIFYVRARLHVLLFCCEDLFRKRLLRSYKNAIFEGLFAYEFIEISRSHSRIQSNSSSASF